MSDIKKFTFIGVTDDLKTKFKALLKEFNVTATPVAPLAVAPVAAAPVAKFGEATLTDGTVIKWEGETALAVETPLMVIDPANPEGFLPIPDGSYETADGIKFTTLEGKVTEVIAPEVVAEVAPATTEVAPGMSAQVAKLREDLDNLISKFSIVDNSVEVKLKAEIESLKTELTNSNKTVKEMFSLFGEALDTPTSNPVEAPKAMSKKDKMLQNLFN